MEEGKLFSINGAGAIGNTEGGKMNIDVNPKFYITINSKLSYS